ncbi:MAG: Fic family protein [Polyangiales bacterium]
MKLPARPPKTGDLPPRFLELHRTTQGPLVNGKYLHWDEVRRRPLPEEFQTHDEWWAWIHFHRKRVARTIHGLTDTNGNPFWYAHLPEIDEQLHLFDRAAGGAIAQPDEIANPETRGRYHIATLIEEAIASSQIEGAATTRRDAKEMLRSGRQPRDKSERMIFNNYLTMQALADFKTKPLTAELVHTLHRKVTDGTLDDAHAAGRFRTAQEQIEVTDNQNQTLHTPPAARELPERYARMCAFANGTAPKGVFLHPVLRAILLHFWLAYDHPYVDGNGRTARSLFYWSALTHGYWQFEFTSISAIIRKRVTQYARAFLHTETDSNDLTYFILFHLKVITDALEALHTYLDAERTKAQAFERQLRQLADLNHRQKTLIAHALRHPDALYEIAPHSAYHTISYATARSDLLDLTKRGLLEQRKVSKRFIFEPTRDLRKRVSELRGREG